MNVASKMILYATDATTAKREMQIRHTQMNQRLFIQNINTRDDFKRLKIYVKYSIKENCFFQKIK